MVAHVPEDPDPDEPPPGPDTTPGPGKTTPNYTPNNTNFPKCNTNGDSSKEKQLWKIVAYDEDASAVANLVGVSEAVVLGWAASETQFSNSAAIKNNNYFDLTGANSWGGIPCNPGFNNMVYACFGTFYGSAIAAFSSTQNSLRDGTGMGGTGISVIQIMNTVLNLNPDASLATIFQAVADAGFDPKGSSTNAGYGQRVSSTIDSYQKALDCMRKNGYL
jgi:hypothetical protein